MSEIETTAQTQSAQALPRTKTSAWKRWVGTATVAIAVVLALQLVRGCARTAKLREIGATASQRFDAKFRGMTMSAVPRTSRDVTITLRLLTFDCNPNSTPMYERVAKQSIEFLRDTGELPDDVRFEVIVLDKDSRRCHALYQP